jgi:hypothetical protein
MSYQFALDNPEDNTFRTAYGPKVKHDFHVEITEENQEQESRTNQQFKNSCDINTILARYRTTGLIEHVSKFQPQYGDISDVEYKQALDTISQAKAEFEALPASKRKEFDGIEEYLAVMAASDDHVATIMGTHERHSQESQEGDRNQQMDIDDVTQNSADTVE